MLYIKVQEELHTEIYEKLLHSKLSYILLLYIEGCIGKYIEMISKCSFLFKDLELSNYMELVTIYFLIGNCNFRNDYKIIKT